LRFSPTRPGDPLLDDTTAKIGIHLAHFPAGHRLTQDRIPFVPGKPLKPPGLEN